MKNHKKETTYRIKQTDYNSGETGRKLFEVHAHYIPSTIYPSERIFNGDIMECESFIRMKEAGKFHAVIIQTPEEEWVANVRASLKSFDNSKNTMSAYSLYSRINKDGTIRVEYTDDCKSWARNMTVEEYNTFIDSLNQPE